MYIYNSFFVKEPDQEVRISHDSIVKAISHHSDWKIAKITDLDNYTFDLSTKQIVHVHVNGSISSKLCKRIEELSQSLQSDLLFIFHIYDVSIIPDIEFNKHMVFCVNTNNKRLALREAGFDNCFILVPSAYQPLSLSDASFSPENKSTSASVETIPDEYVQSLINALHKLHKTTLITNSSQTYSLKNTFEKDGIDMMFKNVGRETILSNSSAFFVFDDIDVSAYLQPWIFDVPVYGTKRPLVIEDFEQKNISFSQVYEKILPVDFVEIIPEVEIQQNKEIIAREYSLNATFRMIQKMLMYGFTDKFQKNFEKMGGNI